jgi:hypothetical protein
MSFYSMIQCYSAVAAGMNGQHHLLSPASKVEAREERGEVCDGLRKASAFASAIRVTDFFLLASGERSGMFSTYRLFGLCCVPL